VQSKAYNFLISPTHSFILVLNTNYHTLSKQDFRITLACIPGHVGIGGNEAAHAAARDVTTQGALVPSFLISDFKDIPLPMYLGQIATGLEPHTGQQSVT
jgi:hypothetical protein